MDEREILGLQVVNISKHLRLRVMAVEDRVLQISRCSDKSGREGVLEGGGGDSVGVEDEG